MILPESPQAALGDGVLITWATYAAVHFQTGLLWFLTALVLGLRAIILWRQVRDRK